MHDQHIRWKYFFQLKNKVRKLFLKKVQIALKLSRNMQSRSKILNSEAMAMANKL